MSMFEQDLDRRPANYVPLSPVSFLTARGSDLSEPRGGDPWRAALHLRPVPGPRSAAGLGAGACGCREGRYGGDHGAQHAADAGGALRGADAGCGAVLDQHPSRCGGDRLHLAPLRNESRADRHRIRGGDGAGGGGLPIARGRYRRCAGGERIGSIEYEVVSRRWRSGAPGPAAGRRVAGHRTELHLRHDRQSEGRGGASSRGVPERLRQCADVRPVSAERVSVDAADVPLQRLDLYLGGDAGRRNPCLPAPGGAGIDLRRHRRTRRDPHVRRAGRAVDADPRAVFRAAARSARPCRSPPAAPRRPPP